MSDRRIFFAVALPIFLLGVVCGGGIVMSRKSPPELWEIDPDFRREEVDAMYADFLAGRIVYTAVVRVLGVPMKVRVVNNRMRAADFGFVPMSEIGDVPGHFWYYKRSEFDIRKYNHEALFVTIKDRYARQLDKIPGGSSVEGGSKGAGQ